MTTTDTEQTTIPTPAPGTVVQVWLHCTTGAAGINEIWNHAGGPAAGKGARLGRLLEPDRPEPFDGGAWSAHTLADVEAALARHGARIITRAEAARRLIAAGYRLSSNRAYGHALYEDQADDVTWYNLTRYARLAFAVYRDERVS
jgi:hypothetical protein